VRLSHNIAMTDVTASASGNDLLLTITGGKDRDSVLVQNYFTLAVADRPRIDFLAGGSWDSATVSRYITSSNDALAGTANADALAGGLGNDAISGGAGDDTLYGAAGNDTMDGGAGIDTYFFGRGDGVDHIADGAAADRRNDILQFGAGITMADVNIALEGSALAVSLRGSTDKIYIDNYTGTALADRMAVRFAGGASLRGTDIDTMLLGADDGLWGTVTNETFNGGAGFDVIGGNEGDDTMYGGTGNDYMDGGAGSDTYLFALGDGQGTVVSDSGDVAGAQDRLIFGADILPADVSASLSGTQDLLLTVGSGGDTVLVLGYYTRAAADRLSIQFSNGWAWDSATVDRKLNTTDDTLLGTNGEDLIDGGLGRDNLQGLDGNDMLIGGDGQDQLDGGTGVDTMVGGLGNDTYIVDNLADVVIEQVGQGKDVVKSSVSFIAPDNIETIALTGTGNVNATGSATAGTGLVGNNGNNALTGGAGRDTLSGLFGVDTLTGGADSDTYYLVDEGDTIVENAQDDGLDLIIQLTDNAVMADNVEYLFMKGTFGYNATGNAQENWIYGNGNGCALDGGGGDDHIFAKEGADTLTGGLGNDELNGGLGNDTYAFKAGDGQDTIKDVDATAGNADTLAWQGINANQVWLTKSGNDLVISAIGTTDSVTVTGWYLGTSYHVESIVAGGSGKTLSDTNVQGLVDAMAAFTPPAAGQTTLPANYNTALSGIIASSWV